MSYRFPISSHLTPGVQPHCWWSIWHHRTHRCHFGQLSLPVNYRSPWFQNQKTMILSCNSLITYGWWSRSHLHVGVYKGCNFLAKMANLTKSCTNSSDTVFVFSSPRVCLHLGHLSSGQFPLFWFQSVVYKWPHHYLRIASHLVACFNLLNTQTCLKWSIKEVQYFFDILLNCTSTVIFQKMSDWFLALAVDLEIIWKVSLEVVKPVCDKTPQKIRQIPSFFLVKYIFRGKGW